MKDHFIPLLTPQRALYFRPCSNNILVPSSSVESATLCRRQHKLVEIDARARATGSLEKWRSGCRPRSNPTSAGSERAIGDTRPMAECPTKTIIGFRPWSPPAQLSYCPSYFPFQCLQAYAPFLPNASQRLTHQPRPAEIDSPHPDATQRWA